MSTFGIENSPIYKRRRLINRIMLCASGFSVVFGLFWLVWILWTLISEGSALLDPAFYTEMTPPPGDLGGGLLNAIMGSVLMVGLAIIIGTPIGILAGTYLAEFGKNSIFASIVRFLNDMLLSAPSIIIGLFIYEMYVVKVKHFSGFAGAFSLAVILIPIVVRSTDNMLKLVPGSLREAAIGLGCPVWKMIVSITYRAAQSGIMTGVFLGIARIAGETAPLLFTALSSQFWSMDMNEPLSNLPVVIFQFAMSPYDEWHRLAWGGAALITLSVLLLNILARRIFAKK